MKLCELKKPFTFFLPGWWELVKVPKQSVLLIEYPAHLTKITICQLKEDLELIRCPDKTLKLIIKSTTTTYGIAEELDILWDSLPYKMPGVITIA